MSAVFEARAFLHDAHYPSMTDADHDIKADGTERFGETDVSELANYNPPTALLSDDGGPLDGPDEQSIMPHDTVNGARLDLSAQSHLVVQTLGSSIHETHGEQVSAHTPHSTPTLAATALAAAASNPRAMATAAGHRTGTPSANRVKLIPKPDREVEKHTDGKYYCNWEGCTESSVGFKRRCEWSKHMDKHERPYRCAHQGCEKLSGFTYSGGLLRHEREVHGKHGGPKKTLNCPHQSCKRYTGKGFSRQENLNEHLRRVHTEGASPPPATGSTPVPEDAHQHTSDNDSERGQKRRRLSSGVDFHHAAQVVESEATTAAVGLDLLEEVKRLRRENEQLRESHITMVAQIADLQGALRLNDANLGGAAQLV